MEAERKILSQAKMISLEERNAEAIDTLRKETRHDISEIHIRIDQILKAINNLSKPESQAWARQSIGLTIAVISIVGFTLTIFTSITAPMQLQIEYIRDDIKGIKGNVKEHSDLQAHFGQYGETAKLEEQIKNLRKEIDRTP